MNIKANKNQSKGAATGYVVGKDRTIRNSKYLEHPECVLTIA